MHPQQARAVAQGAQARSVGFRQDVLQAVQLVIRRQVLQLTVGKEPLGELVDVEVKRIRTIIRLGEEHAPCIDESANLTYLLIRKPQRRM